jgi:RecJ-like exonuclease
MKCRVCGATLSFYIGKGYLHPNGKAYVEKEVPCENRLVGRWCVGDDCKRCGGTGRMMIDDHCVQPMPA